MSEQNSVEAVQPESQFIPEDPSDFEEMDLSNELFLESPPGEITGDIFDLEEEVVDDPGALETGEEETEESTEEVEESEEEDELIDFEDDEEESEEEPAEEVEEEQSRGSKRIQALAAEKKKLATQVDHYEKKQKLMVQHFDKVAGEQYAEIQQLKAQLAQKQEAPEVDENDEDLSPVDRFERKVLQKAKELVEAQVGPLREQRAKEAEQAKLRQEEVEREGRYKTYESKAAEQVAAHVGDLKVSDRVQQSFTKLYLYASAVTGKEPGDPEVNKTFNQWVDAAGKIKLAQHKKKNRKTPKVKTSRKKASAVDASTSAAKTSTKSEDALGYSYANIYDEIFGL